MRYRRILVVILICVVLASSVACSPFGGGGDEDEVKQQQVEVVRDDLVISVSGSGSLDVSNEANLSFGTGGRVDEVYVEEGDAVNEDEVLVKLDTDALELALIQAEAALATAEYNLDKAENPYSDQEISEAYNVLFQAEYQLAYARQMLAEARQEGDPYKIEIWSREVRLALTNVNVAQERLNIMLAAPDNEEVELMELQVEVAERSVEEAQRQLDQATLTAPFDGIVAAVYADEGDLVSIGIPVIHMIDPASMELKAEVDEIDIPRVELGQKAIISVDALPGLQLEGRVSHISPLSTEVSGVVSYGVTIVIDIPEDANLRVGMSAAADIIVYQQNNVLLVPDRAIGEDSQGNPIVRVMVGEEIEERPVVIGVSDGFRTEVIDGLEEGEIVVIEVQPRESPGFLGQ